MIDYSDVDAKLEEYSEAFDFYMDRGEMPPATRDDDCLAGYMREVIDNNPQVDGGDAAWKEVLKEDLIAFFAVLLEQFRAMRLEAMREQALIEQFSGAPIDEKRSMWPEVSRAIREGYSKYEVDLPGFTSQFQNGDAESVLAALTSDWKNACEAKLDRRQRQLLERSKAPFEQACREAGSSDYEAKRRVDEYFHKYPLLREIVDMIGREKDPSKEEKDTVVCRFMPAAISKNSSVEEIDRVESGDNLERLLPTELAMPDDLFYKRYATKELRQFGSPGTDKPRKVEEHKREPRLTKGPIIISIDTSYSMTGRPLKIAFSLLRQLLSMAKRQKRPCFLISFSVRAKSIDLSKPRNWGLVDHFLENGFSGGTDGEQMLAEALKVLRKGAFEMADVLVISDLQFAKPIPATMGKIDREKALGTRFYALQTGSWGHEYDTVMDKIWRI